MNDLTDYAVMLEAGEFDSEEVVETLEVQDKERRCYVCREEMGDYE